MGPLKTTCRSRGVSTSTFFGVVIPPVGVSRRAFFVGVEIRPLEASPLRGVLFFCGVADWLIVRSGVDVGGPVIPVPRISSSYTEISARVRRIPRNLESWIAQTHYTMLHDVLRNSNPTLEIFHRVRGFKMNIPSTSRPAPFSARAR